MDAMLCYANRAEGGIVGDFKPSPQGRFLITIYG